MKKFRNISNLNKFMSILTIFFIYLLFTVNKLEVLGKNFRENANIFDWIILSYLLVAHYLFLKWGYEKFDKK